MTELWIVYGGGEGEAVFTQEMQALTYAIQLEAASGDKPTVSKVILDEQLGKIAMAAFAIEVNLRNGSMSAPYSRVVLSTVNKPLVLKEGPMVAVLMSTTGIDDVIRLAQTYWEDYKENKETTDDDNLRYT